MNHPNIKVKSNRELEIKTDDIINGDKQHVITISDVIEYYKTQANNIVSGCRTLGSIVGDWRPIDHLAQYCLDTFKDLAIDELRQMAIDKGLTPKF